MSDHHRTYPLRRPANHKPPVPRWQLVFDGIDCVFIAYVGVQVHSDTPGARHAFSEARRQIEAWLDADVGADCERRPTSESFALIDGPDQATSTTWVCYWKDEVSFRRDTSRLSLPSIYAKLPTPGRDSIGLWNESLSVPVGQLETNYTGTDYLPGLARLPSTSTKEHTLTAYWGAARDRIPDSAHSLHDEDQGSGPVTGTRPTTLGYRVTGTNHDSLAHIRTGQFWGRCDEEEASSYEEKIEPTLKEGLRYLWDNAESGAWGLRYLRNRSHPAEQGADGDGSGESKETCVAGFFDSLTALERWAKKVPAHLAIYNAAMKHAKQYGSERKFRTWHEVCLLKPGDATFEYINCKSGTGYIQAESLEAEPIALA